MKNVLVLGANSAIAKATCRLWAARGDRLFLVARERQKLESFAQDLKVRGNNNIFTFATDLTRADQHEQILNQAKSNLGSIDIVLIAYGLLGEQSSAERSWQESYKILDVNFISVAAVLTLLSNDLQHVQAGNIAVITSVAGDRGRASNYVYGTAKGALSIFLSGLRNRLSHSNVSICDLRLGFVDTPMTATFPKGPLWATPEHVAKGIVSAIDARKDIVYLPGFWFWIMLIIRNIPERIFKKLRI